MRRDEVLRKLKLFYGETFKGLICGGWSQATQCYYIRLGTSPLFYINPTRARALLKRVSQKSPRIV